MRFSRTLDRLNGMETQRSALIDRSLDLQKQLDADKEPGGRPAGKRTCQSDRASEDPDRGDRGDAGPDGRHIRSVPAGELRASAEMILLKNCPLKCCYGLHWMCCGDCTGQV